MRRSCRRHLAERTLSRRVALPAWSPAAAGTQGGRKMLGTILIGLIAGALAKLLMPGRDPGGFLVTILLGIAGAIAARFIGLALGLYHADQSAGLVGATIGAILILLIYRMVKGRRRV
jgi:uncharacterized membrane protein YeaQ/YmgE (transglycosylase-associated protein family)